MLKRSECFFHLAQIDNDGLPRLAYNDGRVVMAGVTYKVDPPVRLCYHGLHASKRLIHAFEYIRVPAYLCLVTLGGQIIHDTDKSVASERTVHAMISDVGARQLIIKCLCEITLEVIEKSCLSEIGPDVIGFLRRPTLDLYEKSLVALPPNSSSREISALRHQVISIKNLMSNISNVLHTVQGTAFRLSSISPGARIRRKLTSKLDKMAIRELMARIPNEE